MRHLVRVHMCFNQLSSIPLLVYGAGSISFCASASTTLFFSMPPYNTMVYLKSLAQLHQSLFLSLFPVPYRRCKSVLPHGIASFLSSFPCPSPPFHFFSFADTVEQWKSSLSPSIALFFSSLVNHCRCSVTQKKKKSRQQQH